MAETYLYKAGDAGECIFFISHGSMRVELSSDLAMLDSRGVSALQILLHKHTVYSDIHVAGDHFGEYCVVSRAGLRPESVKVLTGSEVYSLSRTDLWDIFQYQTYHDRRSFLYELMTRVGERHHITKKMDSTDKGTEVLDDSRIKVLYRMAFEVMNEIIESLNAVDLLQSRDSEDTQHTELKRLLRVHSYNGSNTDKFSQRDLIDLFETESTANPNFRMNFSENALRSRLSSFNSNGDLGREDSTEMFGLPSESASDQQRGSPVNRPRTASFALPPMHASPSISHLVATKRPNLSFRSDAGSTTGTTAPNTTGAHIENRISYEENEESDSEDSEQDKPSGQLDEYELESIHSSSQDSDKPDEKTDAINSTKLLLEGQHRSPSSSFVHKRILQMENKEKELEELYMTTTTPSPSFAPRKSSEVRFSEHVEDISLPLHTSDTSPFATTTATAGRWEDGVASKGLHLLRRSSAVDYTVVKNALEIAQLTAKRRGSITILTPPPNIDPSLT